MRDWARLLEGSAAFASEETGAALLCHVAHPLWARTWRQRPWTEKAIMMMVSLQFEMHIAFVFRFCEASACPKLACYARTCLLELGCVCGPHL